LVEGVYRAARACFAELNHGVFDDPRYRAIIQDARTYVRATDVTYDIIMDDSVHPGYAGNASLYSRDFFADCRARLSDDGVMSVWTPLFALDHETMKMIVASFRDVFPHATIWFGTNARNKHIVLIGTQRPLRIDWGRFRQAIADPGVRDNLALVDLEDPFVLANCMLMDEASLAQYGQGGEFHTDNHPRLEFACAKAPKTGARPHWYRRLVEMTELAEQSGSHALNHMVNVSEADVERLRRERHVAELLKRGFAGAYESMRMADGLAALMALPPSARPGDWPQQVDKRIVDLVEQYRRSSALAEQALEISPTNRSAKRLVCEMRTEAAVALQLRGDRDLATAVRLAASVLELDPSYGLAYVAMAHARARQGHLDEAVRLARRAAVLTPDSKRVQRALRMLEQKYRRASLRRRQP